MNHQASSVVDTLSERDRKRVVDFVTGHAGIQLPDSKQSLIESRLRKRQRLLGFEKLREYINYAFNKDTGSNEKVHLLDALTTNKTDFYREPHHFSFLNNYLATQLQQRNYWPANAPFCVWSAGCSSGEEAYTLAMELSEIQRQYPQFNFRIYATDISPSCLQKAQDGIYPMERITPVNDELRRRYLYRSKDRNKKQVAMSPQLRKNIRFQELNLLGNSFPNSGTFDVIFCRNVMIYFDNPHRSEISRRFNHCLKSQDILILGHSESLIGNTEVYQQLEPTIYQKYSNRQKFKTAGVQQ